MGIQVGELNRPRMGYTEPFRTITCIDFTPAERKNQLHLVTKSTQIPKHNFVIGGMMFYSGELKDKIDPIDLLRKSLVGQACEVPEGGSLTTL